MPHRMHTGGQIALAVSYLLVGGLAIYPATRPASLIVAAIPDVVVYGAGMTLARDWGHSGETPFAEQIEVGYANLRDQFCEPNKPEWWCLEQDHH